MTWHCRAQGPKASSHHLCLRRCPSLLNQSHASAAGRLPQGSSKHREHKICSPIARNSTVRQTRFGFLLPAESRSDRDQTAVSPPRTCISFTPDILILTTKFSIDGGSIAVFRDFSQQPDTLPWPALCGVWHDA